MVLSAEKREGAPRGSKHLLAGGRDTAVFPLLLYFYASIVPNIEGAVVLTAPLANISLAILVRSRVQLYNLLFERSLYWSVWRGIRNTSAARVTFPRACCMACST